MTEAQFHDLIRRHTSTRGFKTLRRLNVASLDDLCNLSCDQLLATPQCGRNTAAEIMRLRSRLCDEVPGDEERDESPKQEEPERELQAFFQTRLSTRARNTLQALNVRSMARLMALSEDDVLSVPHCGVKTAREILSLKDEIAEASSGGERTVRGAIGHSANRIPGLIDFVTANYACERSAFEDADIGLLLDRYLETRARRVLREMNIVTVNQFLSLTPAYLEEHEGCGNTTATEIMDLQVETGEAIARWLSCRRIEEGYSEEPVGAGFGWPDRDTLSTEAFRLMARYGAVGRHSISLLSPFLLLTDAAATVGAIAEVLALMSSSPLPKPLATDFLQLARHSLSRRSCDVIERQRFGSVEEFLLKTEADISNVLECGQVAAAEILSLQCRLRTSWRRAGKTTDPAIGPEELLRGVSLSQRAIGALRRLDLAGLADILRMTEEDLLRIPGCGSSTVDEIMGFRTQIASVICGDRCLTELLFPERDGTHLTSSCEADLVWERARIESVWGWSVRGLVCARERHIRDAFDAETATWLVDLRKDAIERVICEMKHGVPWSPPPQRPEDARVRQACPLARAAAINCGSRRDFDVITSRLGLLRQHPMTLERLAQQYGLTRERVRQIANRVLSGMMTSSSWQAELQIVRGAILAAVARFGGIATMSEAVTDAIAREELSPGLLYATPIHQMAMDLSPELGERFELDRGVCRLESSLGFVAWLVEVVEREAPEIADETHSREIWSVDVELLKSRILRRCWDTTQYQSVQRISSAALGEAIASSDLTLESGRVYSNALWRLRYGSRLEQIEETLRHAREPLDSDGIAKAMRRWQPDKRNIVAHNISACVSRSRMVLTWDRGKYVHKYNVSVPSAVLAEIEREIINRLNSGIPFYCVHGSLNAHKKELAAAGLKSEMGLYSCLRDRKHRRLSFPRYPYVVARGVPRVPVSAALEEFASQCGGPFQIGELRDYASKELGMSDVVVGLHFYGLPSVVCLDEGVYCHVSHVPCTRSSLAELEAALVDDMRHDEVVSIRALYARRKVRCIGAGIRTPRMLYDMLEHYGTAELVLLGFPRVSLSERPASGSIREEFEVFLRDACRVCSYEELEEEFVSKRGFRLADIYRAASSGSICRYATGALVHTDTIEWNESKTAALAAAADEAIALAAEAGRPYQYIDWFIESQRLPELEGARPWTPTLVVDRLIDIERFAVLGSAQTVFVKLPNECDIRSFADLVRHIIETEYSGAAELAQFEDDMVERKLINRRITQSMLGEEGPVTICGNVIALSELAKDA